MIDAWRASNAGPHRLEPVGRLGVVVFCLFLFGSVEAGQSAPSAAPQVADWEVFASKGCAGCHQVRGFGDGTTGPDLGHIASGTGFIEIAAAMWNHVPQMRVAMRDRAAQWPRFTPQEFSNLIEFLFTAQYTDIARDPVEGQRLFASRGCDRCHATSETGERPAPPLAGLGGWTTSVLMATAMWNHVSSMGEAMDAAGVDRRPFAGPELQDIVAYIRTVARDPRGEQAPLVVGVPDRGQRLFVDKGCARCHAVQDQGATPRRSLAPRAPRATIADLPVLLWNHRATIRTLHSPALTGQDMADITAHLHALYYFDPPPGDPPRGRRLLQDKGCLGCHSLYGKGGRSAPDFSKSNVVSSKVGQLTAMWNHGPIMENEAKRRSVTLPTLSGQELSDITAYLAGVGGGLRSR